MEESALVAKAEKYLKEISNDSISLDNIEEFENFKRLYYKLDDRLNSLQELKENMDAQGYTTPFTSLNKYGTKAIAEVSLEEMSENSRHNQMFRMKANAKKNVLDRVKSAIDAHKIAIGHLEQCGYLKCDSCYKKYSLSEFRLKGEKCSCGHENFSFKINKDATYRLEIIPYLPLSGNYLVLMSELSGYGRNSFKKVLNILKQERKGLVKTISLVIRFRDENGRWIRKNVTLDSEYISNYEDDIENMIVFYDGENGECSGYIYDAGIFPELGDKNRIDFRIYEVKNGDVYMDMDICRLDSSGFSKDGNREAEITAKYNISKRKTTEYDSRGGSLFNCDRIISSESENALYLETSKCAETHLNMSKDRLEYIRSLILDSAEENGLLV